MHELPPRDSSQRKNSQSFSTTHWSIVLGAMESSTEQGLQALETLCTRYWYPLYAYARRRGYSALDAADMTQQFFAILLEKQGLRSASPERGRFRAFLLTAFKHMLANEWETRQTQKRGGKVHHFPIDIEVGEQRYHHEPADHWTPELLYDRRWALTVLDQVLGILEGEYRASGRLEQFAACRPYLVGEGPSYDATASSLGIPAGTVRVIVHRLRSRYRELLRLEVAMTLENPAGAEDELEYLRRALLGPG